MLPSRRPRFEARRFAVRHRSVEFTRMLRRFIGESWRVKVRGLRAGRSEMMRPRAMVRSMGCPRRAALRATTYHLSGCGSALSAESQTTPLRYTGGRLLSAPRAESRLALRPMDGEISRV